MDRALAKRIGRMLGDLARPSPGFRRHLHAQVESGPLMGAAGRQYAVENYTVSMQAEKLAGVFHSALRT